MRCAVHFLTLVLSKHAERCIIATKRTRTSMVLISALRRMTQSSVQQYIDYMMTAAVAKFKFRMVPPRRAPIFARSTRVAACSLTLHLTFLCRRFPVCDMNNRKARVVHTTLLTVCHLRYHTPLLLRSRYNSCNRSSRPNYFYTRSVRVTIPTDCWSLANAFIIYACLSNEVVFGVPLALPAVKLSSFENYSVISPKCNCCVLRTVVALLVHTTCCLCQTQQAPNTCPVMCRASHNTNTDPCRWCLRVCQPWTFSRMESRLSLSA